MTDRGRHAPPARPPLPRRSSVEAMSTLMGTSLVPGGGGGGGGGGVGGSSSGGSSPARGATPSPEPSDSPPASSNTTPRGGMALPSRGSVGSMSTPGGSSMVSFGCVPSVDLPPPTQPVAAMTDSPHSTPPSSSPGTPKTPNIPSSATKKKKSTFGGKLKKMFGGGKSKEDVSAPVHHADNMQGLLFIHDADGTFKSFVVSHGTTVQEVCQMVARKSVPPVLDPEAHGLFLVGDGADVRLMELEECPLDLQASCERTGTSCKFVYRRKADEEEPHTVVLPAEDFTKKVTEIVQPATTRLPVPEKPAVPKKLKKGEAEKVLASAVQNEGMLFVHMEDGSFKTLAVQSDTTVKDVVTLTAQKVNLPDPENYCLCMVSRKSERILGENERPLEMQDTHGDAPMPSSDTRFVFRLTASVETTPKKQAKKLKSEGDDAKILAAIQQEHRGVLFVHLPDGSFRTFPIKPESIAYDVCDMAAKKMNIGEAEDYELFFVDDKAERKLEEDERPLEIEAEARDQGRNTSFVLRRHGEDALLLEGFLEKQKAGMKWLLMGEAWSRKWFRLTGDRLCYFRREGDTEPAQTYLLSEVRSVHVSETISGLSKQQAKYQALVLDIPTRSPSVLYLLAGSSALRDHWVMMISRARMMYLRQNPTVQQRAGAHRAAQPGLRRRIATAAPGSMHLGRQLSEEGGDHGKRDIAEVEEESDEDDEEEEEVVPLVFRKTNDEILDAIAGLEANKIVRLGAGGASKDVEAKEPDGARYVHTKMTKKVDAQLEQWAEVAVDEFESCGKGTGVELWRIMNRGLSEVPDEQMGIFASGDCYLLLKTMGDTYFSYNIHYWIGEEADVFKMGVAALFAMSLDRLVCGGRARHFHEVQGGESDTFYSYFGNKPVQYVEGSAPSGFNHVQPEIIEPYLVRVTGWTSTYSRLAPLAPSSLNPNDVFILDTGKLENTIFVWEGPAATSSKKVGASHLTDTLSSYRRKDRPNHIFVDDAAEWARFVKALGGGEPVLRKPLSKEEELAAEARDHFDFVFYSVSDVDEEIEVTKDEGIPSRDMLDPSETFILDCQSELYVWFGRDVSLQLRTVGGRLGEELFHKHERPPHTMFVTMFQGHESPLFLSKFYDWELSLMETPDHYNASHKRSRIAVCPSGLVNVDFEKLLRPQEEEEDPMFLSGSLKVKMWIVDGTSLVEVSKDKFGSFASVSSYVVQCSYSAGRHDKHVRLFFWEGRKSKKVDLLFWILRIKKMSEEEMFEDRRKVQMTHVLQNQEPLAFINLFDGKMIVHYMSESNAKEDIALFEVLGTSPHTARGLEVNPSATSLNSSACFILRTPRGPFAWFGKTSSQDLRDATVKLTLEMQECGVMRAVQEGSETPEFWQYIGGRDEYAGVSFATYLSEGPLPPPRLFPVVHNRGRLEMEMPRLTFRQDNLTDESIFLLDISREVFVWTGSCVRTCDVATALDIGQQFVDWVAIRREGERGAPNLVPVEQGKEPKSFTCHFPAWDPLFTRRLIADPWEDKAMWLQSLGLRGRVVTEPVSPEPRDGIWKGWPEACETFVGQEALERSWKTFSLKCVPIDFQAE